VHWDGFKQQYWSAANGNQKQIEANAALIVAAINALPGLIESARRVEEMRAALKRVRDLLALSHPAPDVPTDTTFVSIGGQAFSKQSVVIGESVQDVPGAEEVEAIRARHDLHDIDRQRLANHQRYAEAHTDRATLLRLLDAAREELREVEWSLKETLRCVEYATESHDMHSYTIRNEELSRQCQKARRTLTRAQGESS
jgi:hypothetical protein